jgi:hypothetical protein
VFHDAVIDRASMRRKHRIEDVFHDAVIDDQREVLQKRHPTRLEDRQLHCASELEVFIREERERQMQVPPLRADTPGPA